MSSAVARPATDYGLLGELAAAAGRLQLDAVPAATRTHAARVIADTLGVVFGGARNPEVGALARGEPPLFPAAAGGEAQILTPGLPRADAVFAAFVNGTAGTFLELDEGSRPTGHPAVHVLPAAFAAAQALHASGRELVTAFLAGYEVTARLFSAYRMKFPLHPHGNLGAVGAAVAVARLRGADPAPPAAIASALPLLTVWQPCYEGATVRNAFTGVAGAVGLLANRMAAAGFTGSAEAQPTTFGELVGELVRPEALTDPIEPERLRITGNYFKLHSACALAHSALDAALALGPVEPGDVVRVEVETQANNLKIAREARPNDLSTRFSLPYAVAAAVFHGHTRPDAFVPDGRVARLAERVEVRAAPDLEASWPDAAPARVTISTLDGVRTERVDNPRGHHANPAAPPELRSKFELLVGAERAGWYDLLLAIEDAPDVAAILAEPA